MHSRSPLQCPDPSRQRLRLALRDAARAFYCQMYYWGRDVMHPSGNLLVRYGFEKIQRTTKKGTSRYRLTWEGGLLELHGFCAGWYPATGPGICFDRKHDAWRIWEDASPPEPELLVAGHGKICASPENLPLLLQLTAHFSRWVIGYEAWAHEKWGPSQRRAQHRDFMKLRSRRKWLAPDLSRQWLTAYAKEPTSAPRPKTIQGNNAHC
jgi:hypothetical protein